MFSINKEFFSLISVSLFMILFSMIFSADAFAAGSCTGSQQPCCKNGQLSCCAKLGTDSRGLQLSYDLSGCEGEFNVERGWEESLDGIEKVASECTSGQVQYQPSGSCGTSSRKCCSNGKWSGWGASCPSTPTCSSSQCLKGSSCENKGAVSRACFGNVSNASSGTQTRTATCNSGSGWSYTSWSGTCICKTGYSWNRISSTCVISGINPPGGGGCRIGSCPSGQHMVNAGTSDCCCEFNNCGKTVMGNNIGACKCLVNEPSIGF